MDNKEIFEKIQQLVDSNDVVLFMKGTKDFPQCGFSSVVVAVLQKLGVTFHDINILEDMDLRQALKDFSDWPTFPQLYVKGEFIGGCDIVKEMYEDGELQTLLKERNINLAA